MNYVLNLIKKNNIIKDCYKKADHFINLASNALSVFEESEEKRKRAEVVLRCVAKDSNPTYLKTLVDQYFTEENDKKDK